MIILRLILLCTLASPFWAWQTASNSQKALTLYEKTDYSASAKLLEALPSRNASDWNLLGRNYFMMGDYKRATDAFEKATQADPNGGTHWHWLGRTFGRRAEIATFLTAPGYASKARQNFERAVQLDSRNQEALNDLFEYYLQAPGFLGGGLDKAEGLIERIGAVDPAERSWAMARVAEQRKDFKTAEAQLRRSFELAPKQIGRAIDLAIFLARRGRAQESDVMFEAARKISPNHPSYLWQRANILVEQKRNLPEAEKLLKQYLTSQVDPGEDHKKEARKLLSQISGA
jgi:tetratricopeptide (TPR) repeat protein